MMKIIDDADDAGNNSQGVVQNCRALCCAWWLQKILQTENNVAEKKCRSPRMPLQRATKYIVARQATRQPAGVPCQVLVAIATAEAAGAAIGRCSHELSWMRWRTDLSGSHLWRAKNASSLPKRFNWLSDRSSSGFKIDGIYSHIVSHLNLLRQCCFAKATHFVIHFTNNFAFIVTNKEPSTERQ